MRLPHARRGFTLVETLIAVAIAALLSMVAVPSFQGQLQRARRTDALVALLQIELAQARWRSNNDGYASLKQIGVPATSGAGHYTLRLLSDQGADGYTVVASAQGAQRSDTGCRVLRLNVIGGDSERASGPDEQVGNDAMANRRCWGQ